MNIRHRAPLCNAGSSGIGRNRKPAHLGDSKNFEFQIDLLSGHQLTKTDPYETYPDKIV